jgi:hypothetical protein
MRAVAQAVFFRRRHQPRRLPLAKIRPGRPAPAMGPGTAEYEGALPVEMAVEMLSACGGTPGIVTAGNEANSATGPGIMYS